MAIIGYIRVSSNKQTLEHQEFEIKKFAKDQKIEIDRWVEEKISSRKALNKRRLGQKRKKIWKKCIIYWINIKIKAFIVIGKEKQMIDLLHDF